MSAPVLTEFVVGQTDFCSRGVSELKLTRDGKAEIIQVPIRSVGIAELQEELSRQRPKPPTVVKPIQAASALGKALDLEVDQPVEIIDMAHEGYRKELAEWQQRQTWALIIRGLGMRFVTQDGREITDPATIRQALEGSGITGHHIDQLMTDIQSLTRRRERRADFLSESASG